jgi:hypothetical protein
MHRKSNKVKLLVLATAVSWLMAQATQGAEPAKQKPAGKAPNPVMQPIQDDPNLPRVLLIGDSISIGYTLPVRKLLEGKASSDKQLPTSPDDGS